MTYANLYDKQLQDTITKFKNTYLQPLDGFRMKQAIPTDIVPLLGLEKTITSNIQMIKGVVIPVPAFDARTLVQQYYSVQQQSAEEQRKKLRADAQAEKMRRTQEFEQTSAEVKQYNSNLSSPYRAQHKELLEYRDELKHVFERYDITPMDVKISDDLSAKEFEMLIKTSIDVCRKYTRVKDNNLLDRILKPIHGERNLQFTLGYTALILVGAYIAAPFIAIPLFVKMSKSVHGLYKDIEALRVASALMTQVDYNRFVSAADMKEAPELVLNDIDEKLETDLTAVQDVSKEMNEALDYVAQETPAIQKQLQDAVAEVKSECAKVQSELEKQLTEVKSRISEFMSSYHPFPTVANDSVVFDRNFVLGKIEGQIDVREAVPMKNIVFDSTNREFAINSIKLYLANALLAVRVKQLTVEIYDPVNMCSDFTEFMKPETQEFIRPNTLPLQRLLDHYKAILQQSIIELDKQDIDTYNKIAEEKEIVPKAYQLLIIVSDLERLKKDEEGKKFSELMRFSAQSGLMIWLMDNTKYPDTVFVSESMKLKANALEYSLQLGAQATKTYMTALAKFKDRGIDYVTKLGNVFIPREKWWTWDTIKGVYMPWGLEKGDPTRGGDEYWPQLGDANVHGLLGGATGAGKSAEINQHLISLITMYPPSELQIVYIDFKNVEAAKFTSGYDVTTGEWMSKEHEKELRDNEQFYKRLSRIPHLRIISGTTDGEYALSVFEFLMQEMQRRQSIINKFGVTKVQEMREQILAGYNKEHNGDPKKGTWAEMRKDWDWYKPNVYDKYGDLPRLVVIFDEFQVMYNPEFVDNRTIDTINGKITAITKLARAMACHFWFTSQSMKGTMSKDTIANFSLRGALRCTTEVSDELLGNPAAGTIKAKFGFMYSNDSAGQDKTANRLWRVPFLDEKKMPWYVDQLNDMLDEFNEKHLMAEFYDEKILVPDAELHTWYQEYRESFQGANTFILGERATYSTNKAPTSVSLVDDGGENMFVAAFDKQDMMNLGLTILDNLRESGVTTIINCQDKDTYNLMAIDEIVNPNFAELSKPTQDVPELVKAIEGMLEARKAATPPYTPCYIVLIQWERAPSISVGGDFKLQDRFKAVLRDGPSLGVHFVFVSKEKLEMPRLIPQACNHRICGFMPKDSIFFIETNKVEKLPDVNKDAGLFAIYEYGSTRNKFRIYQHTFTRTIASREVVIN